MVLEDIFNSNIYRAEQIAPQSDEYKAECRAVSKLMNELKTTFNSQSRLLQAVRNAILNAYPRSDVRADGQVVKIAFLDGIR